MELIDADFSPELTKDKQRDVKKNGSSSFESNGSSSNQPAESRPDAKQDSSEKSPDVKEELNEAEAPESTSLHNSPNEDKPSPGQQAEKDVPSAISTASASKGTKGENGENSEQGFRNESCENVLPITLPSEPLHEGVQPLPSNIVSKQPVTMEAQYMQQQSQIFVFSTSLANKAADAVLQGQYASIISYHCAQPRTKKYLEGTNQQNQMMQNSCGPNMNMEQNKPAMPSHSPMMPSHSNSLLPDPIMPLGEMNQQDLGIPPPQPLAGVKVPDENLTPQQRQHREEQLATLRKMQQILFPEALSGPDENVPATVPSTMPSIPSTLPSQVEENAISENLDLNKPSSNQSEWQKMQMQFFDDQKSRKTRTNGPPPSYQQATRSASVPIALQSPNPSSPNNTTSNLSLPSPRTCSGINSPADKVTRVVPGPSPTMESPNPTRNANSNPPTPVSSHLSPKHKDKLSTSNEFSPSSTVSAQNSQQSPADSLYCRTSQSMSQQKPGPTTPKEPNLMPVPSPQQIQYLNTFEGQELTIQKQPNTSLKEAGSAPHKSPGSPPLPVGSLPSQISPKSGTPTSSEQPISNVRRFGYESEESQDRSPKKKGKTNDESSSSHLGSNPILPQNPLEGVLPNTSTPKTNEFSGKLNESSAPSTPDVNRNFSSDLSTPGEGASDSNANQSQRKLEMPYCNSPQANERCHMSMQTNYMQKCSNFVENPANKCGNPAEKDMASPSFPCIGPDNVPLNPNRINTTAATKTSHFDPISSLAQMSQQLTNNVPNSPVNQQSMIPNVHQNMSQYGSPGSNQHMMMGEMHHIPNTAPDHRMQPQMQPHFNTPRPQCSSAVSPGMPVSPKMMQGYGPPQRPVPRGMNYNGASIQVKPNAPNTIQYLPSRPQAASAPRGPPSLEFLRFTNPLSNLDSKLPSHNLQYFPNNYPQNSMNDMGMCTSHPNIRGPMRPSNPGMMRMQSPQMGFNSPENFQNSNCQFLGGPSKNPSLGLAPDASQPLPPSMGQNNNFKNSSFIGPTTADPNYAQQFHNFQQQLYATNTRGQLTSQNMAGNQHYFMPK